MPPELDAIRSTLACGPREDGRWYGWVTIGVEAAGLRRLGLHPDQPSAVVAGPSPPGWWHAEAERRFR